MTDVFKTITCAAANRQSCRDLISTIYPEQGPTCFLGARTTVQGGTVATHYLMSGWIPSDMAALFAPGGSGESLVVDFSNEGWMDVCTRLGLYAVNYPIEP